MMIFSVKRNSKYMELTISGDSVTFISGLLDDAEAIDLAKQLISAAEDLLPAEYGDADEALSAVRKSI